MRYWSAYNVRGFLLIEGRRNLTFVWRPSKHAKWGRRSYGPQRSIELGRFQICWLVK